MAISKKKASTSPAKKSTINNDFSAVVDQLLASLKAEVMVEIQDLMQEFKFPERSIPFAALNLDKALVPGNIVAGGSIRKFSSTGIEDLAKDTKLTIMDKMVVVENKLVASQLAIKGNVEIDGNVTINGDTGFDKTTTNKLVSSIAKQVYHIVSADLNRGLENISGDHVKGGTITNFSSTGIEDRAKETQLTIMDDMVVVESKLAAQSLFVKDDVTIEGNLTILGDMPLDEDTRNELISGAAKQVHAQITKELKETLIDQLIARIQQTEFDIRNVSVRGKPLIDGENGLAAFIRKTRITEVSALKSLQVIGEAQLCDSFYAGNKRVGINTVDPAAALAVWDDDVEILIGKHSKATGYIGSLRPQEVIIGAHNKTNIVLGTGGQTLVKDLIADQTRFYSSDKVPNFESEAGAVCFNTKPSLAKPWGWICLGGARWGIMGEVV